MTLLKVWLHTSRGWNYQAFAYPMQFQPLYVRLVFTFTTLKSCKGEGSGQPWDYELASRWILWTTIINITIFLQHFREPKWICSDIIAHLTTVGEHRWKCSQNIHRQQTNGREEEEGIKPRVVKQYTWYLSINNEWYNIYSYASFFVQFSKFSIIILMILWLSWWEP